ncbi:Vacuolar protein sorting 26, putative [Giardia lamblia P15]|uniref:Vacuolar protein sorting 26, putative n=1 Tax=Giardia intestinalis (strain P15) TaxID=658858 RepID=E1F4Q8_GIAIA|nr:Vacuolar protein sorting 26, putative [Giardia lamblia P15]
MSKAQKVKSNKVHFFSFDWNIPSFLTLPKITRQIDDDVRKEVIIVPADTVIAGSVVVSNSGGKSLAYDSVVVELQGVVETNDEQAIRLPFFSVARIAKGAGTLTYPETFGFDFSGNTLPCETINAMDAAFCIKYFLVCTLKTKTGNYSGDTEFACLKYLPKPLETIPIRTEIGVEDTLQLELELNNTFLDISRDMLIGRVHFVHAAKKLEEMAIIIRRRELFRKSKSSTEWFASAWHDIHYYDIMEGAPTREEVIPFRIYMSNLQLSPSFSTDIAKLEYAVVLSLIDSESRSYFRSHELTLYRGFPDGKEAGEQNINPPVDPAMSAAGNVRYEGQAPFPGMASSSAAMPYGDPTSGISSMMPQAGIPQQHQYGSTYGGGYGAGMMYGAPQPPQSGPVSGASMSAGPGPQQYQQFGNQPGSQIPPPTQSQGQLGTATIPSITSVEATPQMGSTPSGPYGAPPPQSSMYGMGESYKPEDPGMANPYGAPNFNQNPYGNPYGAPNLSQNPYGNPGASTGLYSS